jgi:ketosteroid isomerase-like protein
MTTPISPAEAAILAARHVAAFNDAVEAGDFTEFLLLFTDDAVVRFENVPGAGTLEFVGRDAYTRAYRERPPDDQIDIAGTAVAEGNSVTVPFTWRRSRSPGTMRLTFTGGDPEVLDERLVSAMTVTFG